MRTQIKRTAERDEIVVAVKFPVNCDSAFITGQSLAIDGGVLGHLSGE